MFNFWCVVARMWHPTKLFCPFYWNINKMCMYVSKTSSISFMWSRKNAWRKFNTIVFVVNIGLPYVKWQNFSHENRIERDSAYGREREILCIAPKNRHFRSWFGSSVNHASLMRLLNSLLLHIFSEYSEKNFTFATYFIILIREIL